MSYPSRVELTGRSMRNSPELYARDPWFDSNGVASRMLWKSYLDEDLVLPGGVPERAVLSFECHHRVAVPYSLLDVTRGMWWRSKWKQCQRRVRKLVVAFLRSVADKIEMLKGPPVVAEYHFDLWNVRHVEGVQYKRELGQLRGLIQVWTEMGVTADVHADARLWRDRGMPVNYRTAKKAELLFWADTVR